ncbi:hypothetical protein F5890DRAFT_1583702 [Lentinula detonsa]|uniref:L-ornithine N(5)-oxygenase n=1 Tax=Lentinula detonsa TaxID=2804962 RepID=A0AA38Q740_9AGAR|nr:hypothetical protein F5890DRAFT_1583702 [Lentinula detonsa]
MSAKQPPHLVIVGAGLEFERQLGFTDFTPKILAYWQSLYKKHSLERHAKFQTSVHEAEWDEERQVWRVTLRKEKTGKYMEEMIDGISVEDFGKFKGDVWHSAEWRHDVDLKNKTVAVVGNGCSGLFLLCRYVPKDSGMST